MDLDEDYMRVEYLPEHKGDLSLFVDYSSRPKSDSIDSLETQAEINLECLSRVESTLDIGKPKNKRVRFKKTRMSEKLPEDSAKKTRMRKRLSSKPKIGNVDLCRVHATHDEYLNYISQVR